jgi:hypothetical protein
MAEKSISRDYWAVSLSMPIKETLSTIITLTKRLLLTLGFAGLLTTNILTLTSTAFNALYPH